MKLLVTGGAGFIGSAVIRHVMRDQGCSVVNVDKLTYAATPEALMQAADAAFRAMPRTMLLAGDVAAGHATYVQRSATMAFPDYISVRAVAAEGGATLAIWSRSRYGHSDLGVNAKRLDAWIAAIDLSLAE